MRAAPDTSLLFLNTTAHEYDNAGSHAFFERHAPRPSDVALWVHLGAGFAARDAHELGRYRASTLTSPDPQRFLVSSPELTPMLRSAFRGQPGLEDAYPVSAGAAGELEEVLRRGYPKAFGLFGGHRHHHIMSDRVDKVSPQATAAALAAVKSGISQVLS